MESALNFEKSTRSLVTDILEGRWNENYLLGTNSPFWYKLNDSAFLMQKVQQEIRSNDYLREVFQKQLACGGQLSKIKLWLNMDGQSLPMSIMDIYNALLEHLKNGSFEAQLYDSYEVSFVGPLGPFKTMTLLQCLNDDLIEKFIFSHVFQNKLPTRSFRLHTQGKVKVECGADLEVNSHLNVKQITDNGILFSTNEDLLLELFEQGELVRFFIDSTNIHRFMTNGLKVDGMPQDMFYTEDSLRYFFIETRDIIKSLSYKSAFTNEVFFFCRYKNMLESDVSNVFPEFINEAKYLIKATA